MRIKPAEYQLLKINEKLKTVINARRCFINVGSFRLRISYVMSDLFLALIRWIPNLTDGRQKNRLYMETASREWPTGGRPTND